MTVANEFTVPPARRRVLYDGECSVCTALAHAARRRDPARGLDIRPFQAQVSSELPSGVSKKDLECALHVVLEDGRLVRGAAAVFAVLDTLPRWAWLARLGTFPPFSRAAEALYPLFARHRTFWSRLLRS